MAPKKKADAEAEEAARKAAEEEAARLAEEAAQRKAAEEEAARIAAEEAAIRAAQEAEERIIPDLLVRVRQGTPVDCNKALKELCDRCDGDLEAQKKVVAARGIQALIDTIVDGLPGQKEWAVRALSAVTSLSMDARMRVLEIQGIQPLVTLAGASWSNAKHKELAACTIQNLVAEGNVKIQMAVVAEGGLQPLAKLAGRDASTGQQIAARSALARIARGDRENLMKVHSVLGVPLMVDMMLRGQPRVKEMAKEMLGNFESGTAELLQLTRTGTNGQPEVALASLVDLCSGRVKQTAQLLLGNLGGTEVLLNIIANGTTSVKQAAATTLGSMVDGHSGNQSLVGEAGGVHILMDLICNGNHAQKEAGSRALGHLTTGHERNRRELIDAQGIELLLNQARFGHKAEKEAALFALGKLVAGSYETQSEVAARGAIPKLAQMASTGSGALKEAAMSALAELCTGHPENKRKIAEEGSIPQLLGLVERGTPGQQYAAAQTLGVLAYRDGDMQAKMAEHGGVSKLLQLRRTGGQRERNAASLAMLRAAGGSPLPPDASTTLGSSMSSTGLGRTKHTPLLAERGLRRTGSAVLLGQKSGSSWTVRA